MTETPSKWKQFWRHVGSLFDSIEALIYGGLGFALLAYAIYEIASALLESGHNVAFAIFVLLVALSAAGLVRDVRRRQFTMLSKGLLGAWALCVAVVIVVELLLSFS